MKTLTLNIAKFFKTSRYIGMIAMMLLLSVKGFSQDPGGNPDGPPPAVPFDDYYGLILIVAGAIFALFVIRRMQKKQVVH